MTSPLDPVALARATASVNSFWSTALIGSTPCACAAGRPSPPAGAAGNAVVSREPGRAAPAGCGACVDGYAFCCRKGSSPGRTPRQVWAEYPIDLQRTDGAFVTAFGDKS